MPVVSPFFSLKDYKSLSFFLQRLEKSPPRGVGPKGQKYLPNDFQKFLVALSKKESSLSPVFNLAEIIAKLSLIKQYRTGTPLRSDEKVSLQKF